ncbi:MAG: hypothetical protein PHV18_09175 [Lachnospiraceae bacterium]|nr:hypothetical protein [Lachnospiraceae bacterium]
MKIIEKIKSKLPVSRKKFCEQMEELSLKQKMDQQELCEKINKVDVQIEILIQEITQMNKNQKEIIQYFTECNKQSIGKLEQILNSNREYSMTVKSGQVHQAEEIEKQWNLLTQMMNLIRSNRRFTEENIWANVFHDATKNAEWMSEENFTPGRWAIGYQTLYVLFRVLNEVQPRAILELGLGQSTKMISQYVEYNEDILHKVVEHDRAWIENYNKTNFLSKKTEILLKPLVHDELNDVAEIRSYQNFADGIMPQKYNLIVIDGPWGGDMEIYSRIDVAKIMPSCLASSFVILIDDYNRKGEQGTVEYMKNLLDENGIEYVMAKYEGAKDLAVITSKDLEWACTF